MWGVLPEISERDLFWLIGLLEGEGYFLKPMRSLKQPRIGVDMSDLDVIERVAKIWGTTKVSKFNNVVKTRLPRYTSKIHGKKAVALMALIYPHMSERRRSQIDRALGRLPVEEAICGR